MRNFALAYDLSRREYRAAAPGRRLETVTVPWRDVAVRPATTRINDGGSRAAALAGIAVLCAIGLHTAVAWYALSHRGAAPPLAAKKEVTVQLVTPPKPPPPRIEPPKPPPPKALVKRQVLPQIQTALPDTPTVESVPVEAAVAAVPVAVPPPSPPAEPDPVTAPFGRAGYLNNPPPQYPSLAARNGWQGTVLLRVRVLSTGQVDSVEIQKSSGFKLLDEEAKTTVRAWLFTPSKRGTAPIDGWATVPIEFKLDT